MRRILIIRGDVDRFLVCTSDLSYLCPDSVIGRRSLPAYLAGENRLNVFKQPLYMPGAIIARSTGLLVPKWAENDALHSLLTNHSVVGLIGAWRKYIYIQFMRTVSYMSYACGRSHHGVVSIT